MAKHVVALEEMSRRVRADVEALASTQLARLESEAGTLTEGLERGAAEQSLAFEDLAAMRLVELEGRLGDTAESLRAVSVTDGDDDADGNAGRGSTNGRASR